VRYGGEDVDVPAGDIGVGSREVGFLFGRFVKLTGKHTGALTGKPAELGGIAGRTEATGYGCVKFAQLALEEMGEKLEGKRVAISGSGNVAMYAAERCIKEGAKVVTLSGRDGTMRFEKGLDQDSLDAVREGKESGEALGDLVGRAKNAAFDAEAMPWGVECDVAMPCATQNELDKHDAETLTRNGVKIVAEGANMPCTADAAHYFRENRIALGPGKAANAGGVAVSGLEMSQNAHRMPRTREQTLSALDEIMADIHAACVREGRDKSGWVNYPRGANRAGFRRLARGLAAIGVY
jgi:glutamate dehydrogenase (NADP+)